MFEHVHGGLDFFFFLSTLLLFVWYPHFYTLSFLLIFFEIQPNISYQPKKKYQCASYYTWDQGTLDLWSKERENWKTPTITTTCLCSFDSDLRNTSTSSRVPLPSFPLCIESWSHEVLTKDTTLMTQNLYEDLTFFRSFPNVYEFCCIINSPFLSMVWVP